MAVLLLAVGCGEVLGADFDGVNGAGAGGAATDGSSGDSATDATSDVAIDAPTDGCAPTSCYDGPTGTNGIGTCKAGTLPCADASEGVCVGQVLPVVANRCVVDEDVDCDGISGSHDWSRRFGDQQLQRLLHAATDPSGNAYLTGYTWGSIQLNTQTTLSGSLYLIKLDPMGTVAWGKSWPKGQGVAVTPTPDGGVVLAALLDDQTDFGGGPVGEPDTDSGVLVKFSATGAHVWTRPVGLIVDYVLAGSDGKILFGGQVLNPPVWPTGTWPASQPWSGILGLLDANGNPIWIQDYGPDITTQRFARDSKDNIWLTSKMWGIRYFGDDSIGEANVLSTFIAKLDQDGNPIWSRSVSTLDDYYKRSALGVASDDSVWVAAPFKATLQLGSTSLTSAGAHDIGVLHLDSTGTVVHSARFGDAADQFVWDAVVDHDDRFIVAGSFIGSMSAGPCSISAHGDLHDAFLVKLDANAQPMWMHAFGNDKDANFEGYPDDVFTAVGVSADNRILVAGTFDGNTNFGGDVLTGWAGIQASDLVVARYLP